MSFSSFICNHLQIISYKWNITLNDWFICKVNNWGNFCRYVPLVGIYDLSHMFPFSQWSWHFFLTSALVFSMSKILIVPIPSYPFPSLNWVIRLLLTWGSLTYGNCEVMRILENDLFGQHDHSIELIDSFWFCNSLFAL